MIDISTPESIQTTPFPLRLRIFPRKMERITSCMGPTMPELGHKQLTYACLDRPLDVNDFHPLSGPMPTD